MSRGQLMCASAVDPSSWWSGASFSKLKGHCYNLRSVVRLWQSHVTVKRAATVWRAVTQPTLQLSCAIYAVVRDVNQTATNVVFISDVQRKMTHYNTRQTPVFQLCLSPLFVWANREPDKNLKRLHCSRLDPADTGIVIFSWKLVLTPWVPASPVGLYPSL